MKIVTIIGARPQFIKAATVSRLIREMPGTEETIIHTGQHYDDNMSNIFFDELGLQTPKFNLGIGGRLHGAMTGRQLEAIETVLLKEAPDWVLVYGDTNSTLAGTLGAVKLNIKLAHVEAGLRSYNRMMPEEINRVLTDHAASVLFAPTTTAVENLKQEGLVKNVYLTGDVMYDAALYFSTRADERSKILADQNLRPKDFVLVTLHRAENTDSPSRLAAIVTAIEQLATRYSVLWPLHPRTKLALEKYRLGDKLGTNVKLIDPVGYLDMTMLEKNSSLVVTDSGGVQKEAFFHRVPCLTLRNETEWVELVELGWNRLITHDEMFNLSVLCEQAMGKQGRSDQPYGDGTSAAKILSILESF